MSSTRGNFILGTLKKNLENCLKIPLKTHEFVWEKGVATLCEYVLCCLVGVCLVV